MHFIVTLDEAITWGFFIIILVIALILWVITMIYNKFDKWRWSKREKKWEKEYKEYEAQCGKDHKWCDSFEKWYKDNIEVKEKKGKKNGSRK
ncbi:MAG: hypothetical protein NC131_11125 [Roseburia sp.]|nr:hypothetical protein [Roseburia sp.]